MNDITHLILAFILCLPLTLYAADVPNVVEGSEKFNMDMCVKNNKNDCVNANCLTSTDTDCIPNCEAQAQDKCKDMALE